MERTGSARRPGSVASAVLTAAVLIALLILRAGSTVAAGQVAGIDRGVLLWVRATFGGVPGLRAAMLDMTALGDTPTLCLIALAVAGWLALRGRAGSALFLLAQAAAGAGLLHLIKPWFGRVRPDVVAHWAPFAGDSFPSGHSADSAIVYLSLAVIAARGAPTKAMRRYLVAIATLSTMLVGLSRVFLGVHWPSDVLAGWAFGAGWAALSGTIDRRIGAGRTVGRAAA